MVIVREWLIPDIEKDIVYMVHIWLDKAIAQS